MDEINAAFGKNEDSDFSPEVSKKESPLLDLAGSFENLESAIYSAEKSSPQFESHHDSEKFDDLYGEMQSGLISTTRPLVTSNEDDIPEPEKQKMSPPSPTGNLLDYMNEEKASSFSDFSASGDPPRESQQRRDDDDLLIGSRPSDDLRDQFDPFSIPASKVEDLSSKDLSPHPFEVQDSEVIETLPKIKDPKIVAKAKVDSDYNYESEHRAYETAAQPVKSEVAMEAEKSSDNNIEGDCPFSPGAWFNPDKLHPTVAEYVYWKDLKKSGAALGCSLVLLLSFKYYSVISVAAYLILALLTVTISFRIYKNIVQAVQKSNDGHPFKDYLELDITLSQEKIGQTVETLIHHLNCVSGKFRSLILVEDLVDTLKLAILAWCLTYVGAWFNGLTLVILGVVSAFTLPKVYETNKDQIDVYAELVRSKVKEIVEMVNAKMPLGKKKKDQ